MYVYIPLYQPLNTRTYNYIVTDENEGSSRMVYEKSERYKMLGNKNFIQSDGLGLGELLL